MPVAHDDRVRQLLIELVRGGHAHATFDEVLDGFPVHRAGERPEGAPHTAWELLEHMRIAQKDILEFSRSAEWESPRWPEGYWPDSSAPEGEEQWHESVRQFRRDRAEFEAMVLDPQRDLYEPFPWGDGQTLMREAMLVADHNAWHLGQMMMLRRMLGG